MPPIAETRQILADLVAFPTVSSESNLALIAYAADRLSACGARVEILRDETGAKANLFASLGPERDGGIVLSGHTDVVPANESEWRSDPFRLREADGRLYGRGTCDMKGFIAATLAMAPLYARLDLARPIHFAFTFDEEVGCLGARQLVADLDRLGIRPSVAIIGEPTMMRIIEGHKGCYEYTTWFTGLEGHASLPGAGVNAIEYAVRYVAKLLDIGEDLKRGAQANSRFVPPWTTVQAGCIHGGTARNVIARHCAVDWEMRPVTKADADRVKRELTLYCEEVLVPAMRAVSAEAGIVTRIIGEVEGLEPVNDSEARDIVAALIGATSADVVSFGTEAGLFQSAGISTVVCGPGSIEQAHKPDEFVGEDQLMACLDMLIGLEKNLRS